MRYVYALTPREASEDNVCHLQTRSYHQNTATISFRIAAISKNEPPTEDDILHLGMLEALASEYADEAVTALETHMEEFPRCRS
ncbi:hypothetical protein [Pleomorphomonas oryzae]|uniref:hypothetical protein n=1 Tax=Pleomorphomonas oryzae TaxID=261934 RepID=UPI00042244AF|nr:hypothetical protein [Pleomorphomonas oryzae]